MGIFCEINLCKSFDGAFVPGEMVTGVIKYALDEETTFKKILVSLKGSGQLRIKDKHRRRDDRRFIFRNSEEYVDIDHVVQEDEKPLSIGQYETSFSFRLPTNIPPTFAYDNHMVRYYVRCHIDYYVRIKFVTPAMLSFNKHFRRAITVVSGATPKLPTTPTVYGEDYKLFQLFSRKTSIVHIKANVESCVVAPGGKIELNYEIFNDTNVVINAVEIKLKEMLRFKPRHHMDVKTSEHVPDTDTKTSSIKSGETKSMLIVMNVPLDSGTIEDTALMSREYIIKINVELPSPHFDACLEIPIQITDNPSGNAAGVDAPPSYWEVMREDEQNDNKKDDDSE